MNWLSYGLCLLHLHCGFQPNIYQHIFKTIGKIKYDSLDIDDYSSLFLEFDLIFVLAGVFFKYLSQLWL